jgi:two-component system LytT family response regulator
MRVLIVDDEPLARSALANLLAARGDVTLSDFAGDAIEALERLTKAPYDILLLDINMPEVSGMELLERLHSQNGPVPSVIFVTAHSEYAVAAFGGRAVDYVLKPFPASRLNQAMDVASKRSEGERAIKLVQTLPYLQKVDQNRPDRIAIKSNGRVLFVKPGDIVTVHAEGNYVLLQSDLSTYLLRESITAMAQKLQPFGFIRIHRSVLVNSACVEELRTCSSGDYALRVKGGTQFRVTRSYKSNLKTIAASWASMLTVMRLRPARIGTEGFLE